jgi:hypothetical protein
MPARAMMLDEVVEKLDRSVTHDIIVGACCFLNCKKDAVVFITIRYADGSTDVYGACLKDLQKVRAQSTQALERTSRQGVFLYPR